MTKTNIPANQLIIDSFKEHLEQLETLFGDTNNYVQCFSDSDALCVFHSDTACNATSPIHATTYTRDQMDRMDALGHTLPSITRKSGEVANLISLATAARLYTDNLRALINSLDPTK